MRGLWTIALTLCSLSTLLVFGAPEKEDFEVVILGDSYASGVGARGPYGGINYQLTSTVRCFRSPTGFASRFAYAAGATKVTNVACGGGGIFHIFKERQLNNLPKLPWQDCPTGDDFYTIRHPWYCEIYLYPQAEAVKNTTDLVIIAAGGNTGGAFLIVNNCFVPFMVDEKACEDAFNTARSRPEIIQTQMMKALDAIEPKLNSKAKVVVMYYPLPVKDVGYEVGQISPRPDIQMREVAGLLNEALFNATVAGHNSNFATVYPYTPEDFAGHEVDPRLCPLGYNPEAWIIESFLDPYGPEYFHVNDRGHRGLANAMLARKEIFGL